MELNETKLFINKIERIKVQKEGKWKITNEWTRVEPMNEYEYTKQTILVSHIRFSDTEERMSMH